MSDGLVVGNDSAKCMAKSGEPRCDGILLGAATSAPPPTGSGGWNTTGVKERALHWLRSGTRSLMLHGFWRWQWADAVLPVTIDEAAGAFKFGNAAVQHMRYWPPHAGMPYFATDLLEELDADGEYYLNRSSGDLFVIPPKGSHSSSMAVEVSVPLEDSGVTACQGSSPSQECCWAGGMCSFVACPEPAETPGVCSANSTCNDGRDGMLDCQLAPALVRFLHADGIRWLGIDVQGGRGTAIHSLNSSNLLLSNFSVSNMAVKGIVVSGGRNVTIRRAIISHTGMGGVTLSGGNRATLESSLHVLEDSELHHVDRWKYTEVPAVDMEGVGVVVRHNHIHHKKHHAFRQGGNNHRISFNLIEHTTLECWDW